MNREIVEIQDRKRTLWRKLRTSHKEAWEQGEEIQNGDQWRKAILRRKDRNLDLNDLKLIAMIWKGGIKINARGVEEAQWRQKKSGAEQRSQSVNQ